MAQFQHANYSLVDRDRIVRNENAPKGAPSLDELGEVLQEIGRYVQAKIITDMGFVSLKIPEDDVPASTTVLASPDWQTAEKLLVMTNNTSGAMMGIFSRSLCLDAGLSQGSMLPYIERARENGYAVLVMRPNTNSVISEVTTSLGTATVKVPIQGSENPEAHAMYVWENIIPKAECVRHIVLLGYGNGASLCKDMFTRQVVRTQQDESEPNRIKGFIAIEASCILEEDDASDLRATLRNMAVNMECARSKKAPLGYSLKYREAKLGCVTLSLGMPANVVTPASAAAVTVLNTDTSSPTSPSVLPAGTDSPIPGGDGSTTPKARKAAVNVAASVVAALDPVFEYISMSETVPANDLASSFMTKTAEKHGLNPVTAVISVNPSAAGQDELRMQGLRLQENAGNGSGKHGNGGGNAGETESSSSRWGVWNWMFGHSGSSERGGGRHRSVDGNYKLTVSDFDLLKVVGKGAFGKVMLVRKKTGAGDGQVYAMKVLKKSVVAAKGQVEHTMSEREILCEIRHPYIVRLRFAFQSDDKLYLVTDYYNGGSLFYHLRKARQFSEPRAKFYAAELLSALEHLHSQHIIYRDLKLENVLMDNIGHIALTDFGLSKQNVNLTGGATTFCGTAEYIAPELLKGTKYGAGVDWWSFGVLLYEMMYGKTPFYDKNRKLMFYRIINTPPTFPSSFSKEASDVLRGLLTVSESERLGSRPNGQGAMDIKSTKFFSSIDFDLLFNKEIRPPFTPEVTNEFDTKYVPKSYLAAEAKDSYAEPMKRGHKEKFDAFTFEGEKNLGGLGEDDEGEEEQE